MWPGRPRSVVVVVVVALDRERSRHVNAEVAEPRNPARVCVCVCCVYLCGGPLRSACLPIDDDPKGLRAISLSLSVPSPRKRSDARESVVPLCLSKPVAWPSLVSPRYEIEREKKSHPMGHVALEATGVVQLNRRPYHVPWLRP